MGGQRVQEPRVRLGAGDVAQPHQGPGEQGSDAGEDELADPGLVPAGPGVVEHAADDDDADDHGHHAGGLADLGPVGLDVASVSGLLVDGDGEGLQGVGEAGTLVDGVALEEEHDVVGDSVGEFVREQGERVVGFCAVAEPVGQGPDVRRDRGGGVLG